MLVKCWVLLAGRTMVKWFLVVSRYMIVLCNRLKGRCMVRCVAAWFLLG